MASISHRLPHSQTTERRPQVQIRDWRELDSNTLRASFTAVLASGMVLHGCTLHVQGERRWIGLPARDYERDGERKWARIVEFVDRATADRFRDEVLAAIDREGFAR